MKTKIEKLLPIASILVFLGMVYVLLANPPLNAYFPAPDFINIQFKTVLAGLVYYYGLRANIFIDLFYLLVQAIYDFSVLLGYKKRRPFWGTVYDSESKQPLDPVIVTLKDAQSGEVVERAITDIYGRFGFLIRKGVFIIEAQKKGYRFPSTQIIGETDQIFSHLYHGGQIKILSPTDFVAPNIPMDRLEPDFNQEAKKSIVKFYPQLTWYIDLVINLVFGVALLNAVYNYLFFSNLGNDLVLVVYLIALVFKLWPKRRLWGRITNRATQQAFANLSLELCFSEIGDVIVGKAETKADGKYFLKAKPGRYVLKIKKIGARSIYPFWMQNIVVGQDGVFDEDLEI